MFLIYQNSGWKLPLWPPIQLSYIFNMPLWEKKLVIKTVISGSFQLFDLDFYKSYLVEAEQKKGKHSGKRGK